MIESNLMGSIKAQTAGVCYYAQNAEQMVLFFTSF